jgi:hypothetical protein
MKPTTPSLFEQEMQDQVASARLAVTAAERRGDPLLLQAAQNHLDSLVDLARRNGLLLDNESGLAAPIVAAAPAV